MALCGLIGCWPSLFGAAAHSKRKELAQESQPTIQAGTLQGFGSDGATSSQWAIGTEEQGRSHSIPSGSSKRSTVPRASAEEQDTSCFSSTLTSSSLEGPPQPTTSLDVSTEGRLIYWQPTPDSPQGAEQQQLWEAPSLELLAAPLEPAEPPPPPPSPPQAELLPEHQHKSFLDASALHLQLSLPRIRAPRSFDAPRPRLALSDGDAHSPRSSGSDGAAADGEQDSGSDSGDADKDAGNNGGRTARSCTCSLCWSHGNSSSRVASSWAATPAAASTRGGRTPSDVGTPHLPFSRGALEDWSQSQMLAAPIRAAAAAARYNSSDPAPAAAAAGPMGTLGHTAHEATWWRGDDPAGSGSGTGTDGYAASAQTGPAAAGAEDWLLEDQLTPLRRDVALRHLKLSPAKSLSSGSSPGSSHHHHHQPHHHHHQNHHHHHHHMHHPSDQSQRSWHGRPSHRRQASWGDPRQDAVHTALHDQQPRHASFTAGASSHRALGRPGDGRGLSLASKSSPFASLGGQAAAHTQLAGRPSLLPSGPLEGALPGGQRGLGMAGVRFGWDENGRAVMVSHLQAPPAAVAPALGVQEA